MEPNSFELSMIFVGQQSIITGSNGQMAMYVKRYIFKDGKWTSVHDNNDSWPDVDDVELNAVKIRLIANGSVMRDVSKEISGIPHPSDNFTGEFFEWVGDDARTIVLNYSEFWKHNESNQ